jgi:triacylglycerol esterase/lipase EstA (alpha/beta hydrolase family)
VKEFETGTHLIILVHGFLGESGDMWVIENELERVFTDAWIIKSSANERDTHGDIFEMGKNLANEVSSLVSFENENFSKISFVCHSMGGLIARASLAQLTHLQHKFYFLLTLGSPHLGLIYHKSTLVSVGMWAFKKWFKSESLVQMSLGDSDNLENSLIAQLSECEGIGAFTHVFLVGSA